MKHRLLIASVALLLVGCSPPQPTLTVVNRSASTLTNIVASGSGFSESYGTLAPGAQSPILVYPVPRDSPGFKLEFDVDGKHFSEADPTKSFFGLKEVIMIVTPSFNVEYEGVTTF